MQPTNDPAPTPEAPAAPADDLVEWLVRVPGTLKLKRVLRRACDGPPPPASRRSAPRKRWLVVVHLERAPGSDARAAAFKQLVSVTGLPGDSLSAILTGPALLWGPLPAARARRLQAIIGALPDVTVSLVADPVGGAHSAAE